MLDKIRSFSNIIIILLVAYISQTLNKSALILTTGRLNGRIFHPTCNLMQHDEHCSFNRLIIKNSKMVSETSYTLPKQVFENV